jgi:hypothetical protein
MRTCIRATWVLCLLAAASAWGCAQSEDGNGHDGHQDGEPDAPGDPAGDETVTEGIDHGGDDALPDVVPDADADEEVPCLEETIPLSNTQVSYLVPGYARYMHVKVWGAGGNGEAGCPEADYPNDNGGFGGFSAAVFEVEPGTPLIIIVGGPGHASTSTIPPEERMRFGWGMDGGGGLSGIFEGPDTITDADRAKALIVAGGGGGATTSRDNPCAPGKPGNIPLTDDQAMPTMMGGVGSDEGVNGGAGGYRGGKGGTHGVSGWGGEGFVSEDALLHAVESASPGDPLPPRSDDVDYQAYYEETGTLAGVTEVSGLIVIKFVCVIPPVI